MGSIIDKYSKEELEDLVKNSFSYAEVLSKLGFSTTKGHNQRTLKKRILYYNIAVDHFTYKTPKKDWTNDEIFCKDSKVSQPTLRRTVKRENLITYECQICGQQPFWNGKDLVLTLDHINGSNKDNRLENLRWICPNCDRQLDTYGTKNMKKLEKNKFLYFMNDDDTSINNKQDKDNKDNKDNKILIPERHELKKKLWELKNYTEVGICYNVSPTQIRRWCRKYNLPALISIIKYTSEDGWKNENWNDIPKKNICKDLSKPCYMIDKDTNEILKEFSSYREAGKYVKPDANKPEIHISDVCRGKRKTAYGYKWRNKIKN